MKHLFVCLLLIPFLNIYSQPGNFLKNLYQYLENTRIYEQGQEAGHAPIITAHTHLLNGPWKFHYSENPDGIVKDFYKTDFNDSKWDPIVVPSNWQMQGYGNPQFRNTAQPFKSNPPFIPHDFNPVGSYRVLFTVPDDWKDQELFLHFEGVASASFVWVNGKETGYNEGAMEPAEYNITSLVHPGENTLAVAVFQYSDGVYLECQDMWRLGGIFRNVYLRATPKLHIRDYFITTDLDENYKNAKLKITTEIENKSKSVEENISISAEIMDQENNHITTLQKTIPSIAAGKSTEVSIEEMIVNPQKWSAEKPILYKAIFHLNNKNTDEQLTARFGFREVEIKHQTLLVNGVPVKLNGTNSHMQHPRTGHCMDTATMRQDLILMKQFNINCVRTCHYPPDKEYLDLADELGLYIVDETGDESHATEYVSFDTAWLGMYLERVQKIVLRDRNHPSIIIWSAGNESGFGNNICEVIKEGKRLDPSRPAWMYGGNTTDFPGKIQMTCEDIIGPRYPTPFELKTLVAVIPESQDPRPSFMDEYISASGNAVGGMDEYWDIIYKYPRCIGGALWDWVSPGINANYIYTPDVSGHALNAAVMGKAMQAEGYNGKGIKLDGHDQWLELYQDRALDISGNQITLAAWIKPSTWNGCGMLINKGLWQYGLEQLSQDSICFYITTNKKNKITIPLPSNWEDQWHHITGIYNGSEMSIAIDGKVLAKKACKGNITNKPFPVTIGNNAETDGQEMPGYTNNACFDDVCIFNQPMDAAMLMKAVDHIKKQALLWLDMEKMMDGGEYYSLGIGARPYGMVWPDRRPEPELWQVKKSAQPVHCEWIDTNAYKMAVTNRFSFTNLSELQCIWTLSANGKILQQGELNLNTSPWKTDVIAIPVKTFKKEIEKEVRLLISFQLKKKTQWAQKDFEVAWDQLDIKEASNHNIFFHPVKSEKQATLNETSESIFVKGEKFEYRFTKSSGLLTSMRINGTELIKQGPVMNVWRAPVSNERDAWGQHAASTGLYKDGMGFDAANGWRSYGLDKLLHKAISVKATTNNGLVFIDINSFAQGNDYATGFDNYFHYTINGMGEMEIAHHMIPAGAMPSWIPKAGQQWILNKELDQISWYGRGPFENYPDRKTGAKIDIYKSTAELEAQAYLIPQDYGNKSDVRWLTVTNKEGIGIRVTADALLNVSLQKYETDHLTRALYPFQLKPFEGLVLNLDYAQSGVGCTAISVLNQYRVMPSERFIKLRIEPVFK